jgi:EAL domain-containing protein (putative c-di-GMP-specific phosphodiesterase class I)
MVPKEPRSNPFTGDGDAHVLRARWMAAKMRMAMGLLGVAMIIAEPRLLERPALGIVGFVLVALTAVAQVSPRQGELARSEEWLTATATTLIVGLEDERVSALTLLWLASVAAGVMARGGRLHLLASAAVIAGLVLPVAREGGLTMQYATALCAFLGVLFACGGVTRELAYLLRQARRQAERAEALLLAGDIAARVSGRRSEREEEHERAPRGVTGVSEEDLPRVRGSLSQLLAGQGLAMVVQPIIDMRSGAAHAYEALARFGEPGDGGSPLRWFELADRLGERAALERRCLGAALELFDRRPAGARLSVNLSAPVLLDPRTLALLEEVGARRPDGLRGLIIELTEETLINSDTPLHSALAPLRARGARVAVDDMGAGYSGLRQITVVHPSYLKLDRSLVSGIDADGERAALVGALAGYARQVNSLLVAEGIETEAELRALRRLGVPLGQGFYLSRPAAPWPEVSGEVREVVLDRPAGESGPLTPARLAPLRAAV